MPKPSHRNKILTEGLKVLLARGYVGASVRDIVKAAGVPQGSFTNHFTSKEAFAEEVLELYFALGRKNMDKTLLNDSRPPLHRLRQWIELQTAFLRQYEFRCGCLIGNFSVEASDDSERIRVRLTGMVKEIVEAIVYCLQAAVDAGELPASTDVRELAGFLYSSWQGAILQSKVEQSVQPLKRFKDVLFTHILR
ncbi:MAG TPA: TetR family transcriptional regulator C-terminal domain-containing protein [Planctomycetaceae bacterium]|jgi:TetR/AcrR family transcriptional repressor of nem operon|nr:TetR family transcriptional regulator C-terminal domain-containing protein [Planctomycetaceae bacterium]